MVLTTQQPNLPKAKHTESDELLRSTMNAAIDGIIAICAKGTVRLFSQGAERMFGYSSSDILGKNVRLLIPDSLGPSHDDSVQHYISTGERRALGIARRLLAQSKSGEVFSIHLSLGEFAYGSEKMFVGIARDLRKLPHLKSDLDIERQKNRSLLQRLHEVHQASMFNELVTAMSHEINQPLTAITTYADVTRRILANPDKAADALEDNLEKISIQALSASEVIKKMRRMAPKSMLTSGTSDISDLIIEIKDVIEAESEVAGCLIRWSLEDRLPLVRAESSQVQHVLIMLLRNCFTSFSRDSSNRLATVNATRPSDEFVQIAVEDNGQYNDDLSFDTRYHSLSSNETNEMRLKLSMCNTIIVNHGGRIWHEPVEEGGTRYVFTLPVNSPRKINEV
ncbi:MAG: sensor histidine kinase [Gammaproteobacteria bacterium]